jgi:hypothetical protein
VTYMWIAAGQFGRTAAIRTECIDRERLSRDERAAGSFLGENAGGLIGSAGDPDDEHNSEKRFYWPLEVAKYLYFARRILAGCATASGSIAFQYESNTLTVYG